MDSKTAHKATMKSGFSSINFHTSTVERFKGFCRKTGGTYTYTLENMMDFFDKYQLSPLTDFGPTVRGLETNIKKRIDAHISITKNMEKNGVLPTKAMMQLLFEQAPPKEERPELIEIAHEEVKDRGNYYDSLEAIELRKEKNILKQELEETRKRFDDILYSKIKETRPNFGKPRLYLDMAPEEFNSLKETFKND